jgi:predicted O-methyltransferase YrrM
MEDKTLEEQITLANKTLEGWCEIGRAHETCQKIIELKCETYVELGVFGGRSLIPVAQTFKHLGRGVAHGVDPWSTDCALEYLEGDENIKWWKEVNLEEIYRGFVNKVVSLDLLPYCYWYRTRSERAAHLFTTIDALLIDSNHADPVSGAEALLWIPKVKQGGLVIMDDTTGSDTARAVAYCRQECDVISDNGTWLMATKK